MLRNVAHEMISKTAKLIHSHVFHYLWERQCLILFTWIYTPVNTDHLQVGAQLPLFYIMSTMCYAGYFFPIHWFNTFKSLKIIVLSLCITDDILRNAQLAAGNHSEAASAVREVVQLIPLDSPPFWWNKTTPGHRPLGPLELGAKATDSWEKLPGLQAVQ